ncbi:MAG TPA: DUF1800 domain-containing protein [Vicinamibacterales bacterium]|nr:DUF1800 domain-containing protein [Vicinamibacterales bacterium]
MAGLPPLSEHLLRRAGFGVGAAETALFNRFTYLAVVDQLVNYDPATSDVDSHIGTPGYVGITTRGVFSPNTVINDARQRWLFRLVHSPAPLQEKMALFWHQHFATAYSKVSSVVGTTDGARMMAAKPSEDPGGARGQLELFRQMALGNFRDLLIEVAKDPVMLVWLDGRLNTKAKPQENFGRELMELFTFGVEHYVETDVYAAAKVFSGWNLTTIGDRGTASAYYAFNFNAGQHDLTAKEFSFPIYPDGSRIIPSRSSSNGMQDGLDLINALAVHPETARRLARKLWVWFVDETAVPDDNFVSEIANTYLQSGTNMRTVVRAVLASDQFRSATFKRYSWPAEFVPRSLKEVGFVGFSVNDALTPMVNMGQQLFEPPDVNGWELGPGWFSTARTLARMNFAAQLATNQKFALRDLARPFKQSPDTLVNFVVDMLNVPQPSGDVYGALTDYVRAGGTWTGSETQLLNKAGGLFHLVTGSGQYQFV